jgi:hypothetical protein
MNYFSKLANTHELCIIQWNCFKLTDSRIIELRLFLEEFKPDVMSIQEIKMNQEQANLKIRFDGYSTLYKPRKANPEMGGGVVLLIKDTIVHSEITNLSGELDNIGIRVETNDFSFNLISLYSPANTLGFDSVKKFSELGPELFLIGDLNAKTSSVGCKSKDKNGTVLDDILLSEIDLCVLNDESPTYFKYKSEYSEILDLMLASSNLGNKLLSFEVLDDHMMKSDHAPIMCRLSFNKPFKLDLANAEPRFNFSKADWAKYGHIMDDMISGYEWGDFSDIISVNELFTRLLLESGEASVPKFVKVHHKSYPSHILQIIKERQAIRKEKKGKSFEILKVLNSIYNKLTGLMRFKIKEYTEKKWSLFLGSLGPYPASSSIFWNIINRARSQKYSSSIPTLRIGDSVFESDEEKANLFASILGKMFSEDVNSTDFDNVIYSYVEDFVSKIDYSDENYDRCSLEELMSVLKNLRVDSAPGEDGLHNQFLKNLSPKGVILLLKLINLSWEVGLPLFLENCYYYNDS